MDNVSDRNPEDLLREITENGISQTVCINDLGKHLLSPLFEFHRLSTICSCLHVLVSRSGDLRKLR